MLKWFRHAHVLFLHLALPRCYANGENFEVEKTVVLLKCNFCSNAFNAWFELFQGTLFANFVPAYLAREIYAICLTA